MFVRKKKNPSGIVSIQIINKNFGKYSVIKTIGSSSDPATIDSLFKEGQRWIDNHLGYVDIFEQAEKEKEEKQIVEYLVSNIESILINGTQLILDKVFKSIGFDQIGDDILKHLVIARLSQPMSKSGTVSYLKDYFDEDIHYQKIYRYMDTLNNTKQEQIQRISVEHTRKIMGGEIGLMFYDVTTLYFESDMSDELRWQTFPTANCSWLTG